MRRKMRFRRNQTAMRLKAATKTLAMSCRGPRAVKRYEILAVVKIFATIEEARSITNIRRGCVVVTIRADASGLTSLVMVNIAVQAASLQSIQAGELNRGNCVATGPDLSGQLSLSVVVLTRGRSL
jgi:hypothetical protein